MWLTWTNNQEQLQSVFWANLGQKAKNKTKKKSKHSKR